MLSVFFLMSTLACGRVGFDTVDGGSIADSSGFDAMPSDSRVVEDASVDADAHTDASAGLTIVELSPRWARPSGGPITVTFASAVAAVMLFVDGVPCDAPTQTSDRTIDCVAPAHVPATVAVSATTSTQTSNTKDFTYMRGGMLQFGGPGDDRTSGVAIDARGAIYLSGGTTGDLEGINAGDFDAVLMKLEPDGTRAWTRQIGTPGFDYARDVAVDATGDVTIAGHGIGDIDGDGAINGGEDVFVARFAPDGTRRWITQFGSAADDQAWDLGVDASGATYVSIRTFGAFDVANAGGEDFAIARLSPTGVVDWVRQGGTPAADVGHGIAVRADGVAFLVGYTEGDLEGANAGGFDLFAARYDADGTQRWLHQRGTAGDDNAYDAISDESTGVWVVGRTYGGLDGSPNLGGSDVFVMRYGDDGTHVFTRTHGTTGDDVTFGVAATPDGRAYVAGTCNGALYGEIALGGSDLCAVRYELDGMRRWSRLAGGPSTDSGSATAVDLLHELVYVSMNTIGDLDGMGARGSTDMAFARFTFDGEQL